MKDVEVWRRFFGGPLRLLEDWIADRDELEARHGHDAVHQELQRVAFLTNVLRGGNYYPLCMVNECLKS